jgi:hypothetical protein
MCTVVGMNTFMNISQSAIAVRHSSAATRQDTQWDGRHHAAQNQHVAGADALADSGPLHYAGTLSMANRMRPSALVQLAHKLAQDPGAILSGPEIRLLDREVRRALVSSVPGIEAYLAHSEDSTRWHALGEQCRQARGGRGIRDVSVALGVPQYRLRAIEGGLLREVQAELACRYFRFLGIDAWVADWCRANRELATRVGLLDGSRTQSRRRR